MGGEGNKRKARKTAGNSNSTDDAIGKRKTIPTRKRKDSEGGTQDIFISEGSSNLQGGWEKSDSVHVSDGGGGEDGRIKEDDRSICENRGSGVNADRGVSKSGV